MQADPQYNGLQPLASADTAMDNDNPYRPPQHEPDDQLDAVRLGSRAPTSTKRNTTTNSILPRYIAALLDNVIAIVLAIAAAKAVSEDWPLLQVFALLAAYFGYYLLTEGAMSRTPGKMLTGLVVVRVDGSPCSWLQVFVRTSFRVLEVNPILLGAMPAALCIVFSRRRQRFGDMVARTVVIPSKRRRSR